MSLFLQGDFLSKRRNPVVIMISSSTAIFSVFTKERKRLWAGLKLLFSRAFTLLLLLLLLLFIPLCNEKKEKSFFLRPEETAEDQYLFPDFAQKKIKRVDKVVVNL